MKDGDDEIDDRHDNADEGIKNSAEDMKNGIEDVCVHKNCLTYYAQFFY